MIGLEACLHESVWRQDVLLFARLSRKHEFETFLSLKLEKITLFTHFLVD